MINSKNIHLILYIITTFFFLGFFLEDNMLMLYMLITIYVCEFIYLVKEFQKNVTIILFLLAFFTFLMGRIVLPIFIDISQFSDIFYSSLLFSNATYRHIYLSLFLTLIFIFIGYYYVKCNINTVSTGIDPSSIKIIKIRRISKKLVYFTTPFALLNIIDEIRFVLINGYQSVFIEYTSSLPIYLLIWSILYKYFFLLFLATMPSKKEAQLILILFCGISGLNLLAGDRGEAMLALFTVIFYLFLRNHLCSNNEIWISKKGMILLILSAPIFICLLYLIVFFRSGSDISTNQFSLLFGGFFYQQGVSVNVIGCTFQDYAYLPENRLYSLGAILDYFSNNYLSRFLFGLEPYPIGSIELAQHGHSLDPALTYLESPSYYFRGGGMGSSFIAEAWYDFGYCGIILFSLFYGYVLAKIPNWCGKNIWFCIIAMIFFENILYAPRARATTFLVAPLSVLFWPIAYCINYYSTLKLRK